MNTLELKWKIVQQLDSATDETLHEALKILSNTQVKPKINFDISRHMDRLIAENMDLLKRLA